MPPAKRLEDMTEAERLESLKQYAEEQKYVRPGEGGTIPTDPRSVFGLAVGAGVRYPVDGQYTAPIGPPSYNLATQPEAEKKKKKKKGPVKRWLEKRRASKGNEGGEEGRSGEGEKPPEYSS